MVHLHLQFSFILFFAPTVVVGPILVHECLKTTTNEGKTCKWLKGRVGDFLDNRLLGGRLTNQGHASNDLLRCVVFTCRRFSRVTVTHFLSLSPPSEKSSDGPGCHAIIKLSSRCLHKERSNSDKMHVSVVRSGETYLFVELFS